MIAALVLTAVGVAAAASAVSTASSASTPTSTDDDGGAACPVVVERPAPEPSLVAPPLPRGMTRVALDVRPFLGLLGGSWGGVGTARVEHYFQRPFMLGLALAPLAIASDGEGPGTIAHARFHAAYVTDLLAVGLGIGARLQRFGGSGMSIAPTLRLGSLDGLNLSVEYSYANAPNQFTGRRTVGFSNILGTLAVPLSRRLALELDGGLSLRDTWAYFALGLRQRLAGDGGPGTWFARASLGMALVVDRAPCDYDAVVPCGSSAQSFGPTVGAGVERRF